MTLASQTIRVAACNFSGPLPAAWQSGSLQLLDLSDNELTGTLPSSWGEKTALPSLGQLYLQGNALSGEGQGPLPHARRRCCPASPEAARPGSAARAPSVPSPARRPAAGLLPVVPGPPAALLNRS